MSEVEEITQTMETDEEFVTWLRSLHANQKVGNPRLAGDTPEFHFLWARGFHVSQVGLTEITTQDHEQIPCHWMEKFHKDLLAKYFPKGSRLREVTAGECLSVLRPE